MPAEVYIFFFSVNWRLERLVSYPPSKAQYFWHLIAQIISFLQDVAVISMLIPTSNLLQDWVPTPLSFMGLQTLGKSFSLIMRIGNKDSIICFHLSKMYFQECNSKKKSLV
jgi:hypothetical protein